MRLLNVDEEVKKV